MRTASLIPLAALMFCAAANAATLTIDSGTASINYIDFAAILGGTPSLCPGGSFGSASVVSGSYVSCGNTDPFPAGSWQHYGVDVPIDPANTLTSGTVSFEVSPASSVTKVDILGTPGVVFFLNAVAGTEYPFTLGLGSGYSPRRIEFDVYESAGGLGELSFAVNYQIDPVTAPEPDTFMLLGIGGVLGVGKRFLR